MTQFEGTGLLIDRGEAIAIAGIVAERMWGAGYADIAETHGMSPEGVAVMAAVQARGIRDDLQQHGFAVEPPMALLLTITANHPFGDDPTPLVRLIEQRTQGRSFVDLDTDFGGTPGIAATLLAVAAAALGDDLEENGFPKDIESALTAIYDTEPPPAAYVH